MYSNNYIIQIKCDFGKKKTKQNKTTAKKVFMMWFENSEFLFSGKKPTKKQKKFKKAEKSRKRFLIFHIKINLELQCPLITESSMKFKELMLYKISTMVYTPVKHLVSQHTLTNKSNRQFFFIIMITL